MFVCLFRFLFSYLEITQEIYKTYHPGKTFFLGILASFYLFFGCDLDRGFAPDAKLMQSGIL